MQMVIDGMLDQLISEIQFRELQIIVICGMNEGSRGERDEYNRIRWVYQNVMSISEMK